MVFFLTKSISFGVGHIYIASTTGYVTPFPHPCHRIALPDFNSFPVYLDYGKLTCERYPGSIEYIQQDMQVFFVIALNCITLQLNMLLLYQSLLKVTIISKQMIQPFLCKIIITELKHLKTCCNGVKVSVPGVGVISGFLVGACHWDSETFTLYQTMFSLILPPSSKLDTKNPYPILELSLNFYSRESVPD